MDELVEKIPADEKPVDIKCETFVLMCCFLLVDEKNLTWTVILSLLD